MKEDFIPENADRWIFFIAPYIAVVAAFIVMAVVPFGPDWAVITDVNIGILFVLAVSSVGVLALILAGWSSNSKYALLGALRSSAQMVSYEVSMGLAIIGALMFARTLSLSGIVAAQQSDSIWFLLYQPIGFVIFLISGIAENNRAPFDLPEAESELVAGFHTEYSGFRWSLFFMAEYTAMVVVTAVATTLYLGGWYFPFVYRLTEAKGYHNAYVVVSLIVFLAKAGLLLYLYFWLRWTLPRFRYDQLMDLGWKWLLPAALINIVVSAIAIVTLQGLNESGIDYHQIDDQRTESDASRQRASRSRSAWLNLFLTAGILSLINWRSRDFNLKKQRRKIRLVDLPKGKPAVAPVVTSHSCA